jgi:hypothetical protein
MTLLLIRITFIDDRNVIFRKCFRLITAGPGNALNIERNEDQF